MQHVLTGSHKVFVDAFGQGLNGRRLGFDNRQPEGFEPVPVSPEDIQHNQDILDDTTLADLLPGWSLDGVSKGNLVGTDACYLPPYDGERPAQPSIITATAIPLATLSVRRQLASLPN